MDLVTFANNGITIKETCWMQGKPFFTRRAIGEWLEYERPQKAIDKIIERNPHIKVFSTTVNLTAVEGARNVTREIDAYDPIGLQLIVFESRQPKAIQYKVAVAHLVWVYMKGKLKPSTWSPKGDLLAATRQIYSLPEGPKRGALVKDLAEREGISLQTAYRRMNKATGERLLTTSGRPRKTRLDKGKTKYVEERKRVMAYIKNNPHAGYKSISRALNLEHKCDLIRTWVRQYRYNL